MRKPLGKLGGGAIAGPFLLAAMLFLLISPAICHAQSSPTSPVTWYAGQTYTFSVTSPNFYNTGLVNHTYFSFTTADGSNVPTTVFAPDGLADMQWNITIAPAASVPTEQATFLFYEYCDPSIDEGGCAGPVNVPIWEYTLTVQIIGCGTPTITSVTPDGWWATGQQQTITINGSCFLTSSDAGGPSKMILTDGAGAVTLSNVNVVSSTQITASVKVTKKAPAETVTLTVTNPPSGSTPGSAAASPAPVVLPVPVITWRNRTISGDDAQNKNPSVIVGQPVELTTTPATLPGGFTVSKSTWDIDGTTIKKYDGGDSGITLEETDIDTQNTTFYWLYPDDPLNVTYEYCATDPNGNQFCTSPQAKATFNAKGPDSSNALSTWDSDEATIEHLTDCTTNTKSPYLGYGDLSGPAPGCGAQSGTPGIKLTASGASGGKYVFVQLIDADSRTYTSSAGSYTCTTSPNLDTKFPYPPYTNEPNVAPDGPQMPLPSPDLSGQRDFLATMYLLWQPDKLNGATKPSIPVPIGHQQWQFKAITDQKKPIGNGKWEKPTLNAHGDTGGYVPSQDTDNLYGYPVFTDTSNETCP